MTVTGASHHSRRPAAGPAPHLAAHGGKSHMGDPNSAREGWRRAPHQIIAHRRKASDGRFDPYCTKIRRAHVLELKDYDQQNAYRC